MRLIILPAIFKLIGFEGAAGITLANISILITCGHLRASDTLAKKNSVCWL